MHLPLPIRENQPPLLAGRRHGREPCTTTLVDGAPSSSISVGSPPSSAWPLGPSGSSGQVPHPDVCSSEVSWAEGPSTRGSWAEGSWTGVHVASSSDESTLAVTCSGETAGGGGEEGALAVTLPPLPRPCAPTPLFFPPLPHPLLGTAVDEEGPGGVAILSSDTRRRGACGMEDLVPRTDKEGSSERSRPAPTIFQHLP